MDFERYTERARAAVQSAQTSALASGHPQMLPEHLLKALFSDRDRLTTNLIRAAGGDPDAAQASIDKLLANHPRSTGGQPGLSQELAQLFQLAEEDATKAGDDFVTIERLLLSATKGKGKAADALKAAGRKFDHKIYTNPPGGHEFNRIDTRLARESRAEIYRFLKAHLKP